MKPTVMELFKAEKELEKKMKLERKCPHGEKPLDCALCKQTAIYQYFEDKEHEQKIRQ